MSQKEKLIEKLKSLPKDFTFEDAETLLKYLEYIRSNKGKTSGSRVIFYKDGFPPILLHKPHPQKELSRIRSGSCLKCWNRRGCYE